MQEFKVAAKNAADPKDVDLIAIPFGERTLYVKEPKPGQSALFALEANERSILYAAMNFLDLILVTDVDIIADALTEEGEEPPVVQRDEVGDTYYLRELLAEGRIDGGILWGGDDENKQGLVQVILEHWAGRPTSPSSASSSSRKGTGRPSTGRSRGKGSTSSPSRSTAS